MRRSFQRVFGSAALLVAVAMVSDVHAGWHHRFGGSDGGSYGGSGGGSAGCDGGSYGSGGGSYGSAGDCGSHGGSHKHGWRARRHGSHGGSYGGSGGGSYGGSAGGSYGGSAGGSAGGVPSFTPEQAAKAEVPKDGVLIAVTVPAEAEVTVNGKVTSSLGANRVFISKGLQAGKKYDFLVTMKTTRNGQPVSEEKKVTLAVGEKQQVTLAGEPAAKPAATVAAAEWKSAPLLAGD